MIRNKKMMVGTSAMIATLVAFASVTSAQRAPEGAPDDGRNSSLNQRGARPRNGNNPPRPGRRGPARFPQEFRTIDGTANNATHPEWGAAGEMLRRSMPPDYADGLDTPAGAKRPSAREVSNLVAAASGDTPNSLGLSDFIWQWGQFVDHDIDETPVATPREEFDVAVPTGDEWFDPDSDGAATIALDRSAYDTPSGVRQQLNNITSYIDASNVYGSDEARANELRALDGTGHLKSSAGDLLPFNVNGFDNAPDASLTSLFLAGDIRANEQVGLTAMHTLFMREHNHWADQIRADIPGLSDDEIYQRARAIVGAEIQAITYNEFLPRMLGPDALPAYTGYHADVDATIANEFATAAYRVGHTMLSDQLLRLDATGAEAPEGNLPLARAFFSPQEVSSNGIDSILRGLASQRAQEVDTRIVDAVRNFLFGAPGSGGFDLASLNIQRGRDHGLASYVQMRRAVGLGRINTFNQITPDQQTSAALAAAYARPQDVDAWVGLLAEPHHPGAFVGETVYRMLRDQFLRLRDGDRFWYQSYLPPEMVDMVNAQTLAVIIRRNTSIGDEIQDDVFTVGGSAIAARASGCPADFDADGVVGPNDLSTLLDQWGECDNCNEDLDADGDVDRADFDLLVEEWGPCR